MATKDLGEPTTPDEIASQIAADEFFGAHRADNLKEKTQKYADLPPDCKAFVDAIGDVNMRLVGVATATIAGDHDTAKQLIGLANDRLNAAKNWLLAYVPPDPADTDLPDAARSNLEQRLREIDIESEDLILDTAMGSGVKAAALQKLAVRRNRITAELTKRRMEQRARRSTGKA